MLSTVTVGSYFILTFIRSFSHKHYCMFNLLYYEPLVRPTVCTKLWHKRENRENFVLVSVRRRMAAKVMRMPRMQKRHATVLPHAQRRSSCL